MAFATDIPTIPNPSENTSKMTMASGFDIGFDIDVPLTISKSGGFPIGNHASVDSMIPADYLPPKSKNPRAYRETAR